MAIFPLYYAGSIGYYQHLLRAGSVIFEAKEHFVKQTLRSRMEILGPNGIQKLSIPTLKNRERGSIDQREISYTENWQKDHWKGLEAAYRRSPYFEFYEHQLRPFYKEEIPLLFDFNLRFHQKICDLIGVEISSTNTTEYSKTPGCEDFRNQPIELVKEDRYLQVFADRHPFTANLSILDAIFNLGPQTKNIL